MTDPNDPNVDPSPVAPVAEPALGDISAPIAGSPPPIPASPSQMFSQEPDDDLVIATLDSEMARLEQSVTRSGWTSWAGTAALGGIAWIFITLIADAPAFPWYGFLVITTILALVQDFIYALEDALRPRRMRGLLISGQTRVMLSKETLPFARKQYCFDLAHAVLLAIASYMLLPGIVGWLWWLPFIAYTLDSLGTVIMLVVTTIDRQIPKMEKYYVGSLVGQSLRLYVAVAAALAIAESWQIADFIALKAALLITAAIHVLRGLAQPQFELPALDKLRDLRRKLGFGQITAAEAVVKAEAELFGLPSLLLIRGEISAFAKAHERFVGRVRDLSERITTLGANVKAMAAKPAVTANDIRVAEALFRDILAAQQALTPIGDRYTTTRKQLETKLEHYKQNTQNDVSIPVVEKVLATNSRAFAITAMRAVANIQMIASHFRTFGQVASRHKLPVSPALHTAISAMEAHMSRVEAPLQEHQARLNRALQEES